MDGRVITVTRKFVHDTIAGTTYYDKILLIDEFSYITVQKIDSLPKAVYKVIYRHASVVYDMYYNEVSYPLKRIRYIKKHNKLRI